MPWTNLTDVRCYYEALGSGEPLILVPGLGVDCRLWDPVLPELAEQFSVIAVDNRGMGRSEARRKPQRLADYAADLVELLDHFQIDRAHVLGLSLGGMIARRMAIDHPSRVNRLVLCSCTDRFTPYLRQMTMLLASVLRKMPTEAFNRTIELLGTSPQFFDANAELIERRVADKCDFSPGARAIGQQLRCVACEDAQNDPRDVVRTPTLVMAGEHDALIPAVYAQAMAGRIPTSEFRIVPGAGHNPLLERPDVACPAIVEFLKSNKTTGAASRDAAGRAERRTMATH
ncbi:MAG: alpha/beta fold hydrolase [Phycisphaerae bacterium]